MALFVSVLRVLQCPLLSLRFPSHDFVADGAAKTPAIR